MKTRLLYAFLLVGCFVPGKGWGQRLLDRMSMEVGMGLHKIGNGNPTGISISLQPTLHILPKFSIGVLYDFHVAAHGGNFYSYPGTNIYTDIEPQMKYQRMFGIIPYYSFNLMKTKITIGYGLAYFHMAGRIKRVRSILSKNIISIEVAPPVGNINIFVSASVRFNKLSLGVRSNPAYQRNDFTAMEDYNTLFVNYKINKEKSPQSININVERKLPFWMLGAGYEGLFPLGKYGDVYTPYIEVNIAPFKNFSIGTRIHPWSNNVINFDKEFQWFYYNGFANGLFIGNNLTNSLAKTSSHQLFACHYIPSNNGWYIIGAGISFHKKTGTYASQVFDFDLNPVIIPAIPAQKNIGGFLKAGFKTGIFRSGLEFHYTGKNIPNYLSFNLGFEFGVGAKWREANQYEE